MKLILQNRNKKRLFWLFSCSLVLCLLGIIPLKLAIAYYQAPYPQAILTLGGGPDRETFTAKFAQKHPFLNIWVSSGVAPDEALTIFQSAGIPTQKIHLNYQAVDTVTNFTTLVKKLQMQGIKHIYLITSQDHMPRAETIATFVLGSQGITFTPVSFVSKYKKPPEPWFDIVRDLTRSIIWIVTGRSGASLNPNYFEIKQRTIDDGKMLRLLSHIIST
jgi:uncharacterized SAM-binding protein YcdF (DUF218 family)